MKIENHQLKNIVIIGCGFSGALTCVNLIKNQQLSNCNIYLIEKKNEIPKGLAYSTDTNLHLLNVPVKNMSALEADQNDFLEYCRLKWDKKCNIDELKNYYLPRAFYGDYLKELVNESIKNSQIKVNLIKNEVLNIIPDLQNNYKVILAKGDTINANYIVMAPGNLDYGNPHITNKDFFNSPLYVQNPWDKARLAKVNKNEAVLIIGTAQTAIDIALVLNDQGLKQPIYMMSRHGLVSQPHTQEATQAMGTGQSFGLTLDTLSKNILTALKQVRSAITKVKDWRLVIDSLRPITQAYWASLTLTEKHRFTRHVQVIWDIHRHRLAMVVARDIDKLIKNQSVKILAGRLVNITQTNNLAHIQYKLRHHDSIEELTVGTVINCTGPNFNLNSLTNPLLKNLSKDGFIVPNELGVSIKTDNIYNVVNSKNEVLKNVFVLGPILKPQLFETVAIPELRKQTQIVANKVKDLILEEVKITAN